VKGFTHFLRLGLLIVALGVIRPRADAQSFGFSVVPSSSSVLVNNSLVYTINITNLTTLALTDVWITNSFSAPFQYVSSSASQPITGVFTNSTSVQFDLGPISINSIVQVLLTVQPNKVGAFTNSVVVAVPGTIYATATNTVVQVTNMVILADLGVTMTGPGLPVITNDLMTYGVTVTNLGPNSATDVALTNTFPAGVIPISPTNQTGTNSLVFDLGTLANGSYSNLFFTVEPTNAGVLPFSTSVGASGVTDTNTANNFASTNILVTDYLSGPLGVTTNSSQNYDAQNGLVEQFVTVTNNTASTIASARVVVSGLTNLLINAVGTNSGNPFVYYPAPLAAGQSVSLLLQYYTPTRSPFSFSNAQLNAFAVPPVRFPAPGPAAVSTNINISRIVQLPNGNILIEWPAVANRTYTVVYSDNVAFSNAMIAPPSITALANRLQWIDYGPPTTVSVPTNSARFYRVYQNP
jgi:uncharacterized repeat protein (TIGR01451 family)